jgi:rhodanese-related sulfurtransferase
LDFIKNNLIWIGLAAVSGGLFVLQTWRARGAGAGVSPMQATLLMNREDAVVVDVREPAEYSGGHIPNARHIPLSQLDKRLSELDKLKERTVIVSCARGNRSAAACGALRRAGFAKVFNLAGGMSAWDQAGLPVTKK